MNSTGRRYATPVTPPPLVSRPPAARLPEARGPVVCLRCEEARHTPRPLVTFAWGRVATPGSRR